VFVPYGMFEFTPRMLVTSTKTTAVCICICTCLQIEGVLAYLKDDLGLEGEDLHRVVKKFPEVINLDVEMRLKANVQHMQKVWHPPCSTLFLLVKHSHF